MRLKQAMYWVLRGKKFQWNKMSHSSGIERCFIYCDKMVRLKLCEKVVDEAGWGDRPPIHSYFMLRRGWGYFWSGTCIIHIKNAVPLLNFWKVSHMEEPKPYLCGYCPARFSTGNGRSCHRALKHGVLNGNKKEWPCEECGKRLTTKVKLLAHIKVVHRGERGDNWKCFDWEKQFSIEVIFHWKYDTLFMN